MSTNSPRIPGLHTIRAADSESTLRARQQHIEQVTGIPLTACKQVAFDVDMVSRKHCENLIGAVHIPLGLAGPLDIILEDGTTEQRYIPMATTEGALIASTSRGCSVASRAGGVATMVTHYGMTRGPVLTAPTSTVLREGIVWLQDKFSLLAAEVEKTSRYAKLLSIRHWLVGRNLFLRFVYSTGDAMGMNMATFATEAALALLCKYHPDIRIVALSGNVCCDKKPSALNFTEGRGFSLQAEVTIPKLIVEQKLHTSVEAITDLCYRKNLLGSAVAGSLGYNAHFANIVAAMFLATGQDPAQVVEGALGITTMEATEAGDLYAAVTIPNLDVGTVGGGTGLATQAEALRILGVTNDLSPGYNSARFAQIIAATVLCGELSLLAALSEGALARAHKALGR